MSLIFCGQHWNSYKLRFSTETPLVQSISFENFVWRFNSRLVVSASKLSRGLVTVDTLDTFMDLGDRFLSRSLSKGAPSLARGRARSSTSATSSSPEGSPTPSPAMTPKAFSGDEGAGQFVVGFACKFLLPGASFRAMCVKECGRSDVFWMLHFD